MNNQTTLAGLEVQIVNRVLSSCREQLIEFILPSGVTRSHSVSNRDWTTTFRTVYIPCCYWLLLVFCTGKILFRFFGLLNKLFKPAPPLGLRLILQSIRKINYSGFLEFERVLSTLTLQQASKLLKIHPVTLQEKARAGEIPGAKIGKCWVFIEFDLIEHIRSQYKRRVLQGEHMEVQQCHSFNAKIHLIGGSKSTTTDDEYSKALALPTRQKLRNTTTS